MKTSGRWPGCSEKSRSRSTTPARRCGASRAKSGGSAEARRPRPAPGAAATAPGRRRAADGGALGARRWCWGRWKFAVQSFVDRAGALHRGRGPEDRPRGLRRRPISSMRCWRARPCPRSPCSPSTATCWSWSGNERVHPADLWDMNWRWAEIKPSPTQTAMVYDPAVRSQARPRGAEDRQERRRPRRAPSCQACAWPGPRRLGAARRQSSGRWRRLLRGAGAGADSRRPYVKRAASRVLLQYATLARGDNTRVRPPRPGPAVLLRPGRARRARRGRHAARGARRLGRGQRADGRLHDRAVRPLRPAGAGAGAQAHRGRQGNVVGALRRRRLAHAPGGRHLRAARRVAAKAASAQPADGAGAEQRGRCLDALGPAAGHRTGDGSRDLGALPRGRLRRPRSA